MPSFRSSTKQSAHLINKKLAIGEARHNHQKDGKVHSDGTANRYKQALKNVSDWMKANNILSGLHRITIEQAQAYLDERSEQVVQVTLNIERKALEVATGLKIKPVRSLLANKHQHRGYTLPQIDLIIQRMYPHNALATQVAHAAGLRAHELLTLRPPSYQKPSTHRQWSKERFIGRNSEHIYTTKGKGGLIREVSIPNHLHKLLERVRLDKPRIVIDRGIKYESFYNLGGGHAWSNSFSRLSSKELGWSDGAHTLRHLYARSRMNELQQRGYNYFDARKIISEEMGHFRGDITEVYLC